ncbi:MAG: GAF domain-containing protein [Anaerolineae bacterium]|jgi:signal transduction histidine kinase|nr:GAF domain-containing protein [Anaerolineae bacterium]
MMMIIFFLNGLSFGGLGLAAYLQIRQGVNFPLKKHLPWLAAFGFICGTNSWVEMFISSGVDDNLSQTLTLLRLLLQPLTGLILLKFGWGIFKQMAPLPAWMSFIPGVLIVPFAYVITYAATTFITPSPIDIPIDIWSRYLLYLPGSVLAGAGFLRQWQIQRKEGFHDVAMLMFGAGMAFLFEAFVVGLIVPAAPYGPASYYNYDRVAHNAFIGEQAFSNQAYGLSAWLDYKQVLNVTGLPIEFWRMISTFAVTFFVVRGLGVFEALRKRQLERLQKERDRAQEDAYQTQIIARKTAEKWTDALVSINRQITLLVNVDSILLEISRMAQKLLKSDFVGLGLLNEDRSELLLKCHGHEDVFEMVSTSIFVDNSLILETVKTNRSFRSEIDTSAEVLRSVCPILGESAQSIASVPLVLDNLPIGALWIAKCDESADIYSDTDLVWLECLADQAVITIQHSLMMSKLQSLSVVEERARIAREMHDGLAQVLGYLNLQVQTLQALFKQGKDKELQTELAYMREAIQSAHADVRENILSLRTTLANEKGLISALDEYIDEFSIQTGLDVRFLNEIAEPLNLASIAEVQLICILQEALANVRKHAKATQVEVLLAKKNDEDVDYVRMEVVDDGIGFAKEKSNRTFGLQTMYERASSVDGNLEIHSTLGKGTTISSKLPCLLPEQMHEHGLLLPE